MLWNLLSSSFRSQRTMSSKRVTVFPCCHTSTRFPPLLSRKKWGGLPSHHRQCLKMGQILVMGRGSVRHSHIHRLPPRLCALRSLTIRSMPFQRSASVKLPTPNTVFASISRALGPLLLYHLSIITRVYTRWCVLGGYRPQTLTTTLKTDPAPNLQGCGRVCPPALNSVVNNA